MTSTCEGWSWQITFQFRHAWWDPTSQDSGREWILHQTTHAWDMSSLARSYWRWGWPTWVWSGDSLPRTNIGTGMHQCASEMHWLARPHLPATHPMRGRWATRTKCWGNTQTMGIYWPARYCRCEWRPRDRKGLFCLCLRCARHSRSSGKHHGRCASSCTPTPTGWWPT